ncbi:MAG: hypothetical protein AAGE94_06995 [Acidobacteriota bacterium]
MLKHRTLIALFAFFSLVASTALCADQPVRAEIHGGWLTLHAEPSANGYQLRVSGPGELYVEQDVDAWQTPTVGLDALPDGLYRWELRAVGEARDRSRPIVDKGRIVSAEPAVLSGRFALHDGAVVDATLPERATKALQYAEDLSVQGSACIGLDCADNEDYYYDTLRLKENNLRIHFDDTSASASFPANDWLIEINDSANNSESYFAIRDETADATLLHLAAGAPRHSLHVDQHGKVGFGTANPAADLHVVSGNTPSLRLEQDGTEGFTPQTWEVVGNEHGFFIKDITHSSAFPVMVLAGAPNKALVLDADGEVGVGTDEPARPIHIVADTAHIAFENTAGTRWNVGANPNDSYVVSRNSSGGKEIEVTAEGAIHFRHGATQLATLGADGSLEVAGAVRTSAALCAGTDCGALADPAQVPSIQDHADSMWALGHLPQVGDVDAGGTVDLNQTIGGLITELELAHAFIDRLDRELQALRAQVEGQ